MQDKTIAFIGGGNMTRSLVGGLISDGTDPERIRVSDPNTEQQDLLLRQHPVNVFSGNPEAATGADVVVMAVKPQIMRSAALQTAEAIKARRPLVMSIAAGIREGDLARWLGGEVAIVRAMPNTPALVQSGATALYANALVAPEQREFAESIMRAVGLTLWLDREALMDAVTALSGSGPAYFFLVMEALESAGIELGLPAETARLLTLQTALGAARLALESDDSAAMLRRRVTSPGGTTERAIQVLEDGHLGSTIERAVKAACARSEELARALGDDQ